MRLDVFLFEKGYYRSRNKAAEACERGEVSVNGEIRTKSSFDVTEADDIKTNGVGYVSVGAYKLKRAIEVFGLDCNGKVFADIGASTGGFTQVLLQNGAKKVYCVDVGEGLLDESISSDGRVVVMDNTNARFLTAKDFPERLDGVTVDCSFISIKTLLPSLKGLVDGKGSIIALIKPQFECGRSALGKSGILLDNKKTLNVLADIYAFCLSEGLTVADFTYSPVNERKNIEFLMLLSRSGKTVDLKFIADVAKQAFSRRR